MGNVIANWRHNGQVLHLRLSDPPGNVLGSEMIGALQAALDEAAGRPGLKLIQFTGAGDHFCFGASVPEHTREKAPAMLAQFHRLFYTLADLNVPTAAMLFGQCLGVGLELALMANFIFTDRTARLGQPEINLAVFAPLASLLLPLKIGQARADDLLLTGTSLTAEDGGRWGLGNAVYPDRATLEAGVETWVEKNILPKSATALRQAVKAARWTFNQLLKSELPKIERQYLDELMATADANEGIAAFIEKRKPVWRDQDRQT